MFQNLTLDATFTRNSHILIKSNVEMQVPPFLQFTEQKNKRSLLAVSNINVPRDLFDVEIDFYGADAQDKLEYSISLTNWTGDHIDLFVNFTKPE